MRLWVRVSDNVLEPSDWMVWPLDIDPATMAVAQCGAAAHDGPCEGWTLGRIARWTCFDPTGRHPETYHEIQLPSGDWKSFASVEEILEGR